MVERYVTINESTARKAIAQAVADYFNGKSVTVTGGVGAQWSDYRWVDGKPGVSERVPGTHDRVTGISGIIHATATDGSVEIRIDYQIQITNVG